MFVYTDFSCVPAGTLSTQRRPLCLRSAVHLISLTLYGLVSHHGFVGITLFKTCPLPSLMLSTFFHNSWAPLMHPWQADAL